MFAQGRRSAWPAVRVAVACLAVIGVLVPASPASGDHPGYEPSFRGQFVAVATANGVECWVAEGLSTWLFWNAIECPEDPGDEVEDAASAWAVELGTLHVLSRTERFESAKIATGADAATLFYGRPYALPPGYMANRTELWVYDGSWSRCGRARYTFNSTTTYLHTPTYHWGGACGSNRWYGSYGTGYQWNGTNWRERTLWSGVVYMPCVLCAAVPTPPPAGPPPRPVVAPPPPPPRPPR